MLRCGWFGFRWHRGEGIALGSESGEKTLQSVHFVRAIGTRDTGYRILADTGGVVAAGGEGKLLFEGSGSSGLLECLYKIIVSDRFCQVKWRNIVIIFPIYIGTIRDK